MLCAFRISALSVGVTFPRSSTASKPSAEIATFAGELIRTSAATLLCTPTEPLDELISISFAIALRSPTRPLLD